MVLSIVYLWSALRLPFGTLSRPGPALMPTLWGLLLALVSILYLWHGSQDVNPVSHSLVDSKVVGMTGAMISFIITLEWIGYMAAATLLLYLLFWLLDWRRGWRPFGLALATAVMSFVFFAGWLKVPLPGRSIEDWLLWFLSSYGR